MNKLVFSLLLLLTQLPLRAQTEKGRWNAGVSIGSLSYQSMESSYSFSGSFAPSVGTFVARNMLVGVGIPLTLASSKFVNPQESITSHTNSIGLSPFIRYYLGASALKPYVGAAIGYSISNYKNETLLSNSTNKGTILQVSPSVGLAYFINRSISVNVQVGYNWATAKSSTTYTNGGSGTATDNPATTYKNATLAIGFNIFFGQ